MEHINLTDLTAPEMVSISGGSKWKRLKEAGRKGLEFIGLMDLVDSFNEGWQSVECDN